MKQLDTALQEVFKAISERKKEKKEDKMVSKEPKTKKSVATSTTDEIKQVAKSKPSLWTLEPFYRVESVVENSPSHQCGLKTGDHIVRFGIFLFFFPPWLWTTLKRLVGVFIVPPSRTQIIVL